MKNIAVVLASGIGTRYGADIPKQFVKIHNKTILEYSIEAFENNSDIDEIFVVITPQYFDLAQDIITKNNYKKVSKLLKGGLTRKESSSIAIFSIDEDEVNVLIHDCARPLVSQKIISDCICALKRYDAVAVALDVVDTIVCAENNIITNTLNRSSLKRMQTPQCFKLSLIKKAHKLSENDECFTDDCGLILKHNLADIFIVQGSDENLKITYPFDYYVLEKILSN